MPLLVAITASLIIGGCTAPPVQAQVQTTVVTTQATVPATTQDERIVVAEKIINDTKATMVKEYGEEYLKSEQWKAFEDSYWKGFWQAYNQNKPIK